MATGSGTKDDPWVLKTPPGTLRVPDVARRRRRPAGDRLPGRRDAARSTRRGRSTTSTRWLKAQGDWVPARRRRRAEAGARRDRSRRGAAIRAIPIGGWYGLKKGLRGRFGVYMPPLLEALGLAEVTHDAKNNQMRAI